jgi:hypothetical protein
MERFHRFRQDKQQLLHAIASRQGSSLATGNLQSLIDECQRALACYQIQSQPHWHELPDLHYLPAMEHGQLKNDAAELLIVVATLQRQLADTLVDPFQRRRILHEAQRANEQAQACLAPRAPPEALVQQHRELSEMLDRQ